MIGEIVTGVLTEVVVATGRRIGGALAGIGDGRYREDLEVAAWFNTYRLTTKTPDFAPPPGVTEEAVAQLLEGDACHAVLHELLAAHLCDAPQLDVVRLSEAFGTLGSVLGSSCEVGDFTAALFGHFDQTICTLVGRLEGGLPDAVPKLREGAVAARIVAALHAIERHTAALSATQDPAVERDFLTRYRQHVIEDHGKLDPPDFERRRRVPIADLYVSPDIVQVLHSGGASLVGGAERRITVGALAREIDRTVLLGSPGAGKTTASHVLMHHHAEDSQRRVPFMVTLRQFATRDRSVVGHIEHTLETFYQCGAPPGLVTRLLLNGAALVIFDGLDELTDTSRRAEMSAVIERFATEYPVARILVTSRIVGYDQARLDQRQFISYRIGDFDDERVAQYARNWFAQEERLAPGEAERWTAAFVRESAAVPDLRANPLMLALMCILYRGERSIPHDRIGVYEQCASLLFRRWDAQRDIHVDLRARHLVEPLLRHLAHWLFTREIAETAVTERQLIAETATFLQRRGFETHEEALEGAGEFVGFCRGRAWVFTDAGTTTAGDQLFTFTHRTFLEYFAAYHLAVTHDTPERLARTLMPRIARREWDVAAELAIQIKDRNSDRGAERIVTAILAERRNRSAAGRANILRFLARCLDSIDLPPHVVRRLTRRILDHTFLADRRDRGAAAIPLGTLLVSCWPCREIVRDEISARVTAMADSSDPEVSLDGVRLAAWCDSGSTAELGATGGLLTQSAELAEFWSGVAKQYHQTYRTQILAASKIDPGCRYLALSNGSLTTEQVLARSTRGLAELFDMNTTGLFAGTMAPWMLGGIAAVIGVDQWYAASRARTDCAALGRFLIDSWPQPPWDLGHTGWKTDLVAKATSEADLAVPEYVGAAIGLLVFAEHIIQATPGLELDANALGPLRSLRPYLERRLGRAPDSPLPGLPIPDHIQESINAWADRRITFDVLTQPGPVA